MFQYVATGSLTGRLDLEAAGKTLEYREFPVRLSPPWYKTVLGIGGLLGILAGFAYLEGSLRAFRRGRRRVSAYIGAAISSGVIAVGVIAIAVASGHANATVGGIIVAVVLSAGAGIALGRGRAPDRAAKRRETGRAPRGNRIRHALTTSSDPSAGRDCAAGSPLHCVAETGRGECRDAGDLWSGRWS